MRVAERFSVRPFVEQIIPQNRVTFALRLPESAAFLQMLHQEAIFPQLNRLSHRIESEIASNRVQLGRGPLLKKRLFLTGLTRSVGFG